MANDTSKTAKITKRLLPTSTSPKCQCTAEKYHLFAIFAVLDVSFVVNSCLNRNFLHIYLQFYYISVGVTWYVVQGTEYVIPTIFEVLL